MKNSRLYMMGGVILICLIVVGFVLLSSKKTVSSGEEIDLPQEVSELVGNDQDDHGCIASAGYTWSELLQECIRPFEKGIKLLGVDSDDAVFAAYLVFNDDQSQVEVFMPKEEYHPILHKDVIGVDEVVWVSSENDTPVVKKQDGKFSLVFGEKIEFVEE